MELRDRIRAAQAELKLNAQQMAAQLRITPEWLSKIMNGRVQGSDDIGLRLDDLRRRAGIESGSIGHTVLSSSAVCETPGVYGTADTLRREIMRFQMDALAGAGDDLGRLGWLREELRLLEMRAPWAGDSRSDENPAVRAAREAGRRKGFLRAAQMLAELQSGNDRADRAPGEQTG